MLETNKGNDFLSVNPIDLQSVVAQMEKDLAMAGYTHAFEIHETHALLHELSKVLEDIDRAGILSNVLYRIDVKEEQLKTVNSYYEALSKACWNRAFQKVWFRNHFKTGSK